jgi:membrane-associated phospholipid phosphatase
VTSIAWRTAVIASKSPRSTGPTVSLNLNAHTVALALLLSGVPLGAQQAALQTERNATDGVVQATAVATATRSPSFVVSLAHDIKRLPSLDTAWILGVGGALALAASPEDPRLTRTARGTEAFEETFDPGETLGSGWIQVGGALGTLALGHLTSSPQMRATGSDLLRAQILTGLLTQGLKRAIDRTRPDGSHYSFPSGHASASFATAAVLQRHFGWMVGVPAFGVAAYASTSRLSENRHYASDVIFGAALGLAVGRTVTIGSGERRLAVVPSVVHGGVAVNFVRIATP